MARPETCCPECGHSPVGEESCDRCGAFFARIRPVYQQSRNTALLSDFDELDDEKTTFSQELPDAVSVRPLSAGVTFLCAAAAFFFEARGALGVPREPMLMYGLAALDLAIGIGILLRLGLFRALAYLTVPVHIAALMWAARDVPFSGLAITGVLFPLATLIGTVLEPGTVRRLAGLAICIVLLGGRAWLVLQSPAQDSVPRRLEALAEFGVGVSLPPDFTFLDGTSRREPLVRLPPPSSRTASVDLASSSGEFHALIWVERQRSERGIEKQVAELASKLLGELDAYAEEGRLDFAPGQFSGTTHVSVLFRREAAGRDQKGMLLVAAQPGGDALVASAVVAPSASDTLLRLNAAKVFTSIRLRPDSAAAPTVATDP